MSKLSYFLFAALVVIVALNVVYASSWYYGEIRSDDASEIEKLHDVQNQWVEQVELLIVIDRLSFSLQCAELDKKEMLRALGETVKANNDLRLLIRRLMKQQYGDNAPDDFAVPSLDRST